MSLRVALLSFVVGLAALFVVVPARAQAIPGPVSVAVIGKDALPRVDATGNQVAKRSNPVSAEGVNLSDCHADQSIEFPLTVTGFLPGDVSEIWASNGAVDCTDPQFRPGPLSVHCVKLGSFPLTSTSLTTIKVKTLLTASGITTLDSQGCPIVDISSITLYFMVFRGGTATTAVGSDTVPIMVDTQGPLPLTGVKALSGNQAITVSWDAVGEPGVQDIMGAQALCDPAPAASRTIPGEGLACTTAAFSSSTAVPCGAPLLGTSGNTIRIDNINGTPLQNGVVYAVAVAATDSFENVGSVSSAICQLPDDRRAGGQSGGCSVEGPAIPVGSFTPMMMIGLVMTLSRLRRRSSGLR